MSFCKSTITPSVPTRRWRMYSQLLLSQLPSDAAGQIRTRILGNPDTTVRLVFRRQDQERNDYEGGNGDLYFYNVELVRKLDRKQMGDEMDPQDSEVAARVRMYEEEIIRLRREMLILQQYVGSCCIGGLLIQGGTDGCWCRKTEDNPRSKALEAELKSKVEDMRE